MRVKDVMSSTVVGVSPDNSIRQAARIMLDHRVSGLPVVGGDGQLVGIISEGDLIRRTELGGGSTASELTEPAEHRANAYIKRTSWKVGDAMTPDPVTIDENAPISQAATLMQRHGIKRIPVTRDGTLVGIVSRADLLHAITAARPDETASGDEAIQRSVMVRLLENTGLEALGLNVTVENGIVHLWGVVESPECKRAARTVAESVYGVRGVVEHFT